MRLLVVFGYLLCFGISDCLWVYPNKKFPVIFSLTIRSVITCILFTILFLFTHNLSALNNRADVINAILISCVSYGGLYCYVKALNYEEAIVIAPVTTVLTSVLGLILSMIFYYEVLTVKIAGCLTGAFIGIALGFNTPRKELGRFKITKGILLSLSAAVLWAATYTFFKTPVDRLGVITFSLILELTLLFINVIILLSGRQQSYIRLLKFDVASISLALIGGLIFFGTLLSSYSYKLFPLLSLNVLGKAGVIIPIVYCAIFLKQRLSIKQICGIGLLIACAIIIAI